MTEVLRGDQIPVFLVESQQVVLFLIHLLIRGGGLSFGFDRAWSPLQLHSLKLIFNLFMVNNGENQWVVVFGGGEYYGRYDEIGRNPGPFAKFSLECDIDARYTMSGTSQQNGVAERRNRTLLDMVRCMLSNSSLLEFLWGEAYKLIPCNNISRISFNYDHSHQSFPLFVSTISHNSKKFQNYFTIHNFALLEKKN